MLLYFLLSCEIFIGPTAIFHFLHHNCKIVWVKLQIVLTLIWKCCCTVLFVFLFLKRGKLCRIIAKLMQLPEPIPCWLNLYLLLCFILLFCVIYLCEWNLVGVLKFASDYCVYMMRNFCVHGYIGTYVCKNDHLTFSTAFCLVKDAATSHRLIHETADVTLGLYPRLDCMPGDFFLHLKQ